MERRGRHVGEGFAGWVRAAILAATSAFVAVGGLGLVEGVLRWFQDPDALVDGGPPGFLRGVAPFFTLYGWTGLALALLFLGPAALVLSRRRGGPVPAVAMAIAAAISTPLLVQIGFALREIFRRGWWDRHESLLVVTVFPLLYILLLAILSRGLRGPVGRLHPLPVRGLVPILLLMAVATVQWPDWRAEGARYRSRDVAPRSAASDGSPNIILITVDALRRDALRPGCLGERDPQAPPTPALDAFLSEAVVYRNAWSSSCWTLPSMAALMTGLPARAMGMEIYKGVPGSSRTMAETALENGYRTGAVATNPYLTTDYGLDMGFQDFEHSLVLEPLTPAKNSLLVRGLNHFWSRHVGVEDADVVLTKAVSTLERISAGPGPFLFWTHLMEPHLPYRFHAPEAFGRAPYRADPPAHPLFRAHEFPVSSLEPLRRMAATLPDTLAAAVRRAYDDEVTYLDARLGRFFGDLKAMGLYESAMIILTADHGEEFFEHGGFEHGHSLMPEVSGIPLAVRLPGAAAAGAEVRADCSLLDILPTLCEVLGWEPPPDLGGCPDLWTLAGPATDDCRSGPQRPRVVEKMLYGSGHAGFVAWPWYGYRLDTGEVRWYDLETDPGALRPLDVPPGDAGRILAGGDALLSVWDGISVRFEAEQSVNAGPSEAVRRQLESLGY